MKVFVCLRLKTDRLNRILLHYYKRILALSNIQTLSLSLLEIFSIIMSDTQSDNLNLSVKTSLVDVTLMARVTPKDCVCSYRCNHLQDKIL